MISILSAGIAPGFALLSYFYLRDNYDQEPISVVIRAFMFGALLVFPLMFIQYVFEVEGIWQSLFAKSFLSIGFLEEFFKWFVLFYTAYTHVEFDDPYDGIVYAVSVSLGFATMENILYLLANGVEYALGRALLPVSSHALFGVIMGFYIGKGKFSNQPLKSRFLFLSLLVPIFLHGTYDVILRTRTEWVVLIIPFMLFLWWFALRKVKMARHYVERKKKIAIP
ncbi:glutamic-type intramembrane protease PrsW [Bacillus fonticola]|uniref:glutamic-type intramembrane protease PrsW n=1 Tax=Bacillus fonticola TaxID=2728853 RepID=UPI001472CD73|nr:glutamic-type intramembrane protease PrsW [Bacillus fonticola]